MINLANLPDIVFADADTRTVEANIITVAEGYLKRTLYPGDPLRLFLEALAYKISQLKAVLDYTGKQNLLRYATGGKLDHLGALVGVGRLGMAPALTTLKFSLPSALTYAAVVPAGTRATADGRILFATNVQAIIPSSALSVEVQATADTPGLEGNGLVPGQINALVDPLPFVVAVENTTESNSGSDVEENNHLRERIQLAPESFSSAGPELAYRFWAMSAHPSIADVSPIGPPDVEPGRADIRVLMEGGALPSDEILSLVLSTLTAEKRRPLTDLVSVDAPEVHPFALDVKWWVLESDASMLAAIQEAMDTAVSGWLEWQTSRIGRDINPSELTRRMINAGAKRVEINSPVFTVLGKDTVARLEGEAVVTYAGAEAV